MDSEKLLFEKGCFLPCWVETQVNEIPMVKVPEPQRKDLNNLLQELDEIKEHIQDARERLWMLDKLIKFHTNGIAET